MVGKIANLGDLGQECRTRVSHKSTAYKSVLQECSSGVSNKFGPFVFERVFASGFGSWDPVFFETLRHQEAPPERRLAIHGAGIVEIAVVSTTDSTSSYSSPQTTTSTTTTTTTTMTTSTTTLPPPPMVIADLPSAKEPLTTTTTSTATVETAIEQKKLTTMDPEQNILDPDYWYGEHHWDGDLSGLFADFLQAAHF